MRFTVVTVCLNAEATIGQCVDSVVGQVASRGGRFEDFEYVVVDGASTDATVDVVRERTAAIRGRVSIISEADSGIYEAMNKGIASATGDYVVFVNADDWLEPDALSTVAEMVALREREALPLPDAVGGAVRIHRRDGSTRVLSPDPGQNARRFPLRMSSGHQATFMRVETLRGIGGFRTRFRVAADYDMYLRLVAAGATWIFTEKVLADFRLGGASFAVVPTARDYRLVRVANGFPTALTWWLFARNVVGSVVASLTERK